MWIRPTLIIGLWLLAFGFCDRGLAWALGRLVLASEARFSRLYRGECRAHTVVLGNSRGVNGFPAAEIERITGHRVLNLSYNGMSAEIAEALLRDYIQHNGAPRLVVLEATCIGSDNDLLQNLRTYGGFSERLTALDARDNPKAHAATRMMHLFRFNNELFLRTLYYLRRSDQDWVNRYKIDPVFAGQWRPSVKDLRCWESVEPNGLAAVRRMQVLCASHQTEFRLVVSPYMPMYNERTRQGPSKWSVLLSAELGGSPAVFDFSNTVTETAEFADPIHMNAEGAYRLARQLAATGILEVPEREEVRHPTTK